MNIKSAFLVGCILISVGCTSVESPDLETQKSVIELNENEKIDFSEFPNLTASPGRAKKHKRWEAMYLAGDFWLSIKKLMDVSFARNDESWSQNLSQILDTYSSLHLETVALENEVFFPVAISENRELLEKELNGVISDISLAQIRLKDKWQGSKIYSDFFKSEVSVSDVSVKMREFLMALPRFMNSMGIDFRISEAIVKELSQQLIPLLDNVSPLLTEFEGKRRLGDNLKTVRRILPFLQEDFPKTVEQVGRDLKRGDPIVHRIAKANGAHDVLRLIIYLWENMSPQERKEAIETQHPTLYSYLNSLSAEALDCLKQTLCNPLPPTPSKILAIATKRFILASLQVKGWKQVLDDVDLSAGAYVISAINQQLHEQLPGAFDDIRDLIIAGLKEKVSEIEGLKVNDWQQLKNQLRSYMNKRIVEEHQLLAWPHEEIVFNGYQALPVTSERRSSGSKALAAYIQSLIRSWHRKPEEKIKRDMVSLVNWGLYMAGLATNDNNKTLAQPYSDESDFVFRLDHYFDKEDSFGIPDHFHADDQNRFTLLDSKQISAKDQWLLVASFVELSRYFIDWRDTLFDHLFKKFTLADFNSEISGSPGERRLFPNDQLYLLFLGLAGQVLDNALRDFSHFVLVDIDDRDRSLAGGDYQNIVMAYTVDFKNGERKQEIDVEGVAQAILSIETFKNATEDIDKTKIPYLLESGSKGSLIEQIKNAEKDLSNLQRALAIFLSRHGFDKNGNVCSVLNRNWKCLESDRQGLTTAMIVRALALVYKQTEVPLFRERLSVLLKRWFSNLILSENGVVYKGDHRGREDHRFLLSADVLEVMHSYPWLFRQNNEYREFQQRVLESIKD